ncbi:hypothetical protein GGR56DRAFT_115024 [Xylariaceae sp. FL0804]|nr:hypothetical protein GGR56DRAFT_115024 [Xylariaceae sp. FL0804]
MSSTPAASAEELARHGWTPVPRDADAILKGRPYVHRPAALTVADMPFPDDDPLVAAVRDYAREHLVEQTFNHSMRVYYWGTAILQSQFPEDEAWLSPSTWALACLLHDIGTAAPNLRGTLLSFEFYGGVLALDLLARQHGAPHAQAEAVAEAIIRHQDLGTEGTITLLGQLIQLATVYDNMGMHPGLVAEETRKDVNRAWPRKGWSGCFARTIREENSLKPWAHSTHLGREDFPRGVEGNKLMADVDGWGL